MWFCQSYGEYEGQALVVLQPWALGAQACAAPGVSTSSVVPGLPSSFWMVQAGLSHEKTPCPMHGEQGRAGSHEPWGAGETPKGIIHGHKSLSQFQAQHHLQGKAAFVFLVWSLK